MIKIVAAAGWPIWFLIVASIVVVALILERMLALNSRLVMPSRLLDNTMLDFRREGVSMSLVARLEENSILGRVFAAGIKNARNSKEVMKEAIEEAGRAAAHELEYVSIPGFGNFPALQWIGTIASISPLLGLFGTVIGMIEIFGSQTAAGNTPAVLAHGISVALYNTAFGLMVAVPSMIAYRHFRAKVDSLIVEMEQQAIKLVELIHNERR